MSDFKVTYKFEKENKNIRSQIIVNEENFINQLPEGITLEMVEELSEYRQTYMTDALHENMENIIDNLDGAFKKTSLNIPMCGVSSRITITGKEVDGVIQPTITNHVDTTIVNKTDGYVSITEKLADDIIARLTPKKK